MSKAVLILDEMPENCGWCNLCDRVSTCMPMERTLGMYYDEDTRPGWCPLREAPERWTDSIGGDMVALGYNMALDDLGFDNDE